MSVFVDFVIFLKDVTSLGLDLWLFFFVVALPILGVGFVIYNLCSCRQQTNPEVDEAVRRSSLKYLNEVIKAAFVNVLNRRSVNILIPDGAPVYKRGDIIEAMIISAAVVGDADGFKNLWNRYQPEIDSKNFLWNMIIREKTTLLRYLYENGYFGLEELSTLPLKNGYSQRELEGQAAIANSFLMLDKYKHLFKFIQRCLHYKKFHYIHHLLTIGIVSETEIVNHFKDSREMIDLYHCLYLEYEAKFPKSQAATSCNHP